MITIKNQKIFLISIIKNKNSIVYAQKQMNRILQHLQHFCNIFVDDIIIRFTFFETHLKHFCTIFKMFTKFNIFIKLSKIYLKLIEYIKNIFIIIQF